MAVLTVTCMTCLHVYVYGMPGTPGAGYGPDGYLPGRKYAETCSRCHPELDEIEEPKGAFLEALDAAIDEAVAEMLAESSREFIAWLNLLLGEGNDESSNLLPPELRP